MVQSEAILDFCDRIVAEFQPQQIILFGSHAYGVPGENSDVDLLVVVAKGPDGWRKAAEISNRVERNFSCDILVRTNAAVLKRIAMNDFFMIEIVEKGIVLHDASDTRVGRKGRKRLQRRTSSVPSAQVA